MENLELASKLAQKHKKWRRSVVKFEKNREENLKKIQESLVNHTFHTSKYDTKQIHEPKERTIFILPFFPDRIVQHAIMNILEPLWDKMFIYDSYACRKGKGQHAAVRKCMGFTRKYEYCLQFDISKFYPSIRHDLMKEVIRKRIKDSELLYLLDDIIDSMPGEKNIPIGNYLSQWFGNVFLNELDRYVKETLKKHEYIRYCDDFLIFGNDKSEMHKMESEIKHFVNERLDLTFSKCSLYHTYQGVDFLGYRCFNSGKLLVRKRTAQRMKRRMKILRKRLDEGRVDLESARSQIASAKGWLKHANTYHLRESIDLWKLEGDVNAQIQRLREKESTGRG